ncbi:MAG: hypothetical protein L0G23_06230 [Ruaniaceae bacterium]|nr:hypothetical protein [Ruaniaceae bacterium]
MTRASTEHQKALLAVQKLDTRLARVAHERRTLPVHARISELEAQAAGLERTRIEATTNRSDTSRELARIEHDVEQIHTRATRHQDRLMAGASAKEAQAIENELALLTGRTAELEDLQLEQMEKVEGFDSELVRIAELIEQCQSELTAAIGERTKEFARIDVEVRSLSTEREAIAAALPSDLIELYDEIRAETGGLGAVAIHGTRTEGVSIDFSLSEIDAINAAPPEEIVISEEQGYILVRL